MSAATPPELAGDELASLIGQGVAAERAEEFLQAGLGLRVGDRTVLLSESVEPITGESRLFAPLDGGWLLADSAAFDEFRRSALTAYPGAERAVLCSWPPTLFQPSLSTRRLSIYLQATPAVLAPAPPDPQLSVREYQAGDRSEVARLLVTALSDGYAGAGAGHGEPADRIAEYVAALFDQVGDGVHIWCSFYQGRFAGHATVTADTDQLTGADRLELLDQFVLPEYRSTPVARALSSAAAAFAAGRNLPLRGHIVDDGEHAGLVLGKLTAQGWQEAESYWLIALDPKQVEAR